MKKPKLKLVKARKKNGALRRTACYTQKELCELLAISRTTLWRRIKDQKIAVIRIGAIVRIHPAEVRKLVGGIGNG